MSLNKVFTITLLLLFIFVSAFSYTVSSNIEHTLVCHNDNCETCDIINNFINFVKYQIVIAFLILTLVVTYKYINNIIIHKEFINLNTLVDLKVLQLK